MTSSHDSLDDIIAKLAKAKATAAQLVDDTNATDEDIRQAAGILGDALVAVAQKDALWSRGVARPDGVDADRWNQLLAALRDYDWRKLLRNNAGNYPALPSEHPNQAAEAIAAALDPTTEVAPTQAAVKELGESLQIAVKDKDTTRATHIRWIRRGLRVAAPLAIGIALNPFVAMGVGAVAATIGIAVGTEVITYCADYVVGKAVDFLVNRALSKDK